tara:strand:- start:317 stop:493 length:177 start_codon:yes stop_codon:yes gene_type:complete
MVEIPPKLLLGLTRNFLGNAKRDINGTQYLVQELVNKNRDVLFVRKVDLILINLLGFI